MVRITYRVLKKSLEMPHFFKSGASAEDSDFKNLDLLQYKTMCDWLRDIHSQNKRISNQLNLLARLVQESSDVPRENPEGVLE